MISLFITIKCATRGRPGGGPVDETPPEIISTFPASDSLGVKNLEKIVIVFSERMNESSVQKALFISPQLEYEIDWSGGDELTLELSSDTLQSNQTYVITIGAEAQDSRRNGLKESFQFAFSTGEQLDQGQISGRVYGLQKRDLMYLFAYKITRNDTIDPRYNKAHFFSQTGNDGIFNLNYLPIGDYRVYVVQDQNKNLLLDAAYERVGIPVTDVTIDSNSLSFENLNFMLTNIDTTAPFISSARAIYNNTVLLRCSEPIINLNSEIVTITDTLKNDTLQIKGLTQSLQSKNQYYIYTNEQDSADYYKLTVGEIADSSGNLTTEESIVYFKASTLTDTLKFKLLNISPPDSTKNFSIFSNIKINFSLPINTYSVSENFIMTKDENDTLNGSWKWNEFKDGFFNLKNEFEPGTDYYFTINEGSIESIWGDTLADSLITHIFTTLSPDEFGTLSGKVILQGREDFSVFLTAQSIKNKSKKYTKKISDTGDFKYTWLPEGEYLLNGYLDFDNNDKWSSGQLIPFKYAEPFHFQNDTIRIRKRWEVTDKMFQIPGW